MPLDELIDRLAAFEPTPFPFVSLYLDTRPDEHGRDHWDPLVRKELPARARTYPLRSAARESLERDIERILDYLHTRARVEANGIAIFACAGAGDFFEAVQLEAPIDRTELSVGPVPHLYPLARLNDEYRRHAAVLLDTHSARIFVFALGRVVGRRRVENVKMTRSEQGGWSQARYQRHVDHFRAEHVREVVDILDRIVREENVEAIVIGGDDVVTPMLQQQLPKHLADKVVDTVALDIRTPVPDVLHATLDAVREQDARDDRENVARMVAAYRAGGLGVVGVDETLAALANGQVYDLLITGNPDDLRAADGRAGAVLADELVTRARQTDARVTLIEDPALLRDVGGVGGLLRYRIGRRAA